MAAALPRRRPTKLELAHAFRVAVGTLLFDIPDGLEAKLPEVWAPDVDRTIAEMSAAGNALIDAAKQLSDRRNSIPCPSTQHEAKPTGVTPS
jgi:hypothetical protein